MQAPDISNLITVQGMCYQAKIAHIANGQEITNKQHYPEMTK